MESMPGISSFNTGNTYGSLSVTRDGTGPTAPTTLFFSLSTFDSNFNVLTSSFGFGTIPGGSLQGDGTGQMSLDVDLSAAPGYTLCTYTPNTGTTCASPGQGTINLTWKRNDQFSYHSVDNLIQSYPGVRYQVSGTGEGSQASVQGSILGTLLVNVFAAGIGVQHQATHSWKRRTQPSETYSPSDAPLLGEIVIIANSPIPSWSRWLDSARPNAGSLGPVRSG